MRNERSSTPSCPALGNEMIAFQGVQVPNLYQKQQLKVIGACEVSGQWMVYVKIEHTEPPICLCLDHIDGCRLRQEDTLVITKVEANDVQLRLQTQLVADNAQSSTFNIKYAYKRATSR